MNRTFLAGFAAVLLLGGCVTGFGQFGATDDTSVPEGSAVELAGTDLDIPIYLHPDISSVTRKAADGAAPVDNYDLGERGWIQSQRSATWYSETAETSLADRGSFDAKLADLVGEKVITPGPTTELRHEDGAIRTVGYASRFMRGDVACIYAVGGYRLGGKTVYDNDTGLIDTVIDAVYCGDEAGVARVERMLSGLRKVTDRPTYAEKLKKAGS
jgi:hypothetical protein